VSERREREVTVEVAAKAAKAAKAATKEAAKAATEEAAMARVLWRRPNRSRLGRASKQLM
jgi:hypothetical protein